MNNQFYDTAEKKIVLVYSLYNQFVSEGVEFKYNFRKYTVKRSDDLQYISKALEWEKDQFDFQTYYRDLNVFCFQ